MRYLVTAFVLLCFGCKKTATEAGSGTQLQRIEWNAKVQHRFSYNADGRLLKEDVFQGCETTPADEFTYSYTGNTLKSIQSVMRSLYSSTAASCDPATGLKAVAGIETDGQGRIQKVVRANGVWSLFQYNAQGFVEKLIVHSGTSSQTHTYERDAPGNIVKAVDGQGNITEYDYDDKINPYYQMKLRPDIVTAYYNSPNNVVKTKSGNSTSEIGYEYNSLGLPVKMFDNGNTYEFVYF